MRRLSRCLYKWSMQPDCSGIVDLCWLTFLHKAIALIPQGPNVDVQSGISDELEFPGDSVVSYCADTYVSLHNLILPPFLFCLNWSILFDLVFPVRCVCVTPLKIMDARKTSKITLCLSRMFFLAVWRQTSRNKHGALRYLTVIDVFPWAKL